MLSYLASLPHARITCLLLAVIQLMPLPDEPEAHPTVLRRDGIMRVVEIGDGQVSDLKEWSPQAFVSQFAS
jgi:hypothetical protein